VIAGYRGAAGDLNELNQCFGFAEAARRSFRCAGIEPERNIRAPAAEIDRHQKRAEKGTRHSSPVALLGGKCGSSNNKHAGCYGQ
jgi:hypothetical protein